MKSIDEKTMDELVKFSKGLGTKRYNFMFYGKPLKRNRNMYAFGDPGTSHSFLKESIPVHPWQPIVKDIRDRIEKSFGIYTNFCLISHYWQG